MSDTLPFALDLLVIAVTGIAVLGATRISQLMRVPAPALILAGTAVGTRLVAANRPAQVTVSRVVTVALIAVLFAGGMKIGAARFRSAIGPILGLGVIGTFATAGMAATFLHLALGFGWYVSAMVATAVAPTDPTVVFSVLGRRTLAGRTGTVLEGESGANDPVGIALMAALLGAHAFGVGDLGQVAATFFTQMAVGGAAGFIGGAALRWVIQRIPLPGRGLDPLRTVAAALLIYGVAAVAHGSGFLAVFLAGIVIGDQGYPHKSDVERFHTALGSLGEMVAFVALGLTVHLGVLGRGDVLLPGLALGAVLALLIRPLVAGLLLWPADLLREERIFVALVGLKGAVPILLGGYLLGSPVADPPRLYGIVIVVVLVSVLAQGGLAGKAITILGLPLEEE
jgi:cell volume regulation protein A